MRQPENPGFYHSNFTMLIYNRVLQLLCCSGRKVDSKGTHGRYPMAHDGAGPPL